MKQRTAFFAQPCEDEQCVCMWGGKYAAAAAAPPSICRPFARVPVNSAVLARCFGKRQCFMSSPHLPSAHFSPYKVACV